MQKFFPVGLAHVEFSKQIFSVYLIHVTLVGSQFFGGLTVTTLSLMCVLENEAL